MNISSFGRENPGQEEQVRGDSLPGSPVKKHRKFRPMKKRIGFIRF